MVLAVLPVAYHTLFIGRDGATPGMRVFDLEVRSWTGRPLDYSQAFLTTVLFYARVSLTAWLVLLVALFTDRSRTLHDILAGTIVLRRTRLRATAPEDGTFFASPWGAPRALYPGPASLV